MKQPFFSAPAIALLIGLLALPAGAELESRVYETLPGTTAEELGGRIPNQYRVVPLRATLTFDLNAPEPSLTAFLPNAVLEGGEPFALTVRSSFGARLPDGTYRFMGDYLKDINPSGTQYLFDWSFSASANGHVLWNGGTYWAGGHIWQITISDVTLLPGPRLTISRAGPASTQITWDTNFSNHLLEYATHLPAAEWIAVTNTATPVGDRISVTVDTDAPKRFYRLREP